MPLDVLRGCRVHRRCRSVQELQLGKVLARCEMFDRPCGDSRGERHPGTDLPRHRLHKRPRTPELLEVLEGCPKAHEPLERSELLSSLYLPGGYGQDGEGHSLLRLCLVWRRRLRPQVPDRAGVRHPGGADLHPQLPAQVPRLRGRPQPGMHETLPPGRQPVPQVCGLQASVRPHPRLRRRAVARKLLGLLQEQCVVVEQGLPGPVRDAAGLAPGPHPIHPVVGQVAPGRGHRHAVQLLRLPGLRRGPDCEAQEDRVGEHLGQRPGDVGGHCSSRGPPAWTEPRYARAHAEAERRDHPCH
mmetsp:Transcript_16486/g.45336  ORF Transcript_16486/g.45336 Transcript_16486/m.45336 type:complete len:300 (+) Transcript_16486:492-1391(+)